MLDSSAPLSPEDERATVAAAKAGDQAATERLVTAHTAYLRGEARRRARGSSAPWEDLFSAGVEATLAAVDTFDTTRGARFLTYLRRHAGHAMAEEVARYEASLPVPGRTLRRYRRAIRETASLDEARALATTAYEMDPETFDAVHRAVAHPVPLDAFTDHGDDENGTPRGLDLPEGTSVVGSRGNRPQAPAEARFIARLALGVLTPRQRYIIEETVMAPAPRPTDREVGDALGVSRPTVSRERATALQAMREAIADAPNPADRADLLTFILAA